MISIETSNLGGFALTAAFAASCRVRISSFVATRAELQELQRGKEQERQQLSQESEATAAAAATPTARRESLPSATL